MNRFIEKYKRLRNNGLEDIEAFGLVAANVAMLGTNEDLQDLYKYHQNDFWNECQKTVNKLEELNNENNQIIKVKVS